MTQTKNQLLAALKSNFALLQKIQATNKEVFKYLPKDLLQSISEGKNYLKESQEEAEDPCSILDRVFPRGNITEKDEKGYDELFKSLVKAIYASDKGASTYEKIKGKNIYFIKAVSSECFHQVNLSNLKPCRFNEMKSYHFICLTSSDNFSVMELYTADGSLVAKLVPKKQLFEDKWIEKEEDIKQVTWSVGEVDFYIKHICVEDETGKHIDIKKFTKPVVIEGKYKDFYLQPFKKSLKDSRPAYTYIDRKNGFTERKATLHIVGSQKEEISKEIILKGMQKEILFEMQHAYSVNKVTVQTDLDFDKCYINGKGITYSPNLSQKGAIFTFGAGLPKGTHSFFIADKGGNKSKEYKIKKDTQNGHIEILFDLSTLSSTDWDLDTICQQVSIEEKRIFNYLLIDVLGKMEDLFEKLDKRISSSLLKALKIVTSDAKNLADISKELMGQTIPFLKGICAVINLINSRVQNAQSMIKARQNNATIQRAREEIKKGIGELDAFNSTVGDYEKDQLVWDYYVNKTNGHATTHIIIGDIKKNFRKIY
jgi:hypothetical protein